jgi:hypothetical protein
MTMSSYVEMRYVLRRSCVTRSGGPTWTSAVDECGVPAKVIEHPLNDRLLLDARNDPELPAAAPTALNINRKHAHVNVHAQTFPAGEIRGQILPTQE